MSITSAPPTSGTTGAGPGQVRPVPVPRPARLDAGVPAPPPACPARKRPQLSLRAQRVLAVAFAVAWVTCPVVQPVPDGPQPEPALWTLPVFIAAVAAITAASITLWRGSRRGLALGVAAGVGMVVETALCPGSGHHALGWYIWVQAGLSGFVLLTSAALLRFTTPVTPRAPAHRR